MKKFDVVIVGGGASGCFCALNIDNNKKVAIIDCGNMLAKKLMVTGNGRCNLTNANCNSNFYNQNLDKYFERFNSKQTIEYFENLGLSVYSDEENRIYPLSNSAKSVVEIINYHINKKHNISCFCEECVTQIKKQGDDFLIETDKSQYLASKVVIATTPKGPKLIQNFDIKTNPVFPSLVSVKTKEKNRRLDGIRVSNVLINCVTKNNKHCSEFGELLFKENGLSGICIFNISCYFSREKSFNGKIFINLLPSYSFEQIKDIIKKNCHIFEKTEQVLCGILHKEIANEILYRSNIPLQKRSSDLVEDEIELLANLISKLEYNIVDCFSNQQVYSGGVCMRQLDNNLQAKNVNKLFFCGEVCDVDGLCGGYNLQWAWTSGYIVAKSL